MEVVEVIDSQAARLHARERRTTAGSLVASLLVHTTAFGGVWLFDAWNISEAELLPVQSGRASIALAASMPAEATHADDENHLQVAAAFVTPTTHAAASQQSSGSPQPRVEPVLRRALAEFLPQPTEVAIPHVPADLAIALSQRQDVLVLGDRGADDAWLASAPEVSVSSEPARRQLAKAEVDTRATPASAASAASFGAEGDQPASILANAPPIYPPDALAARLTGRVILRVTVSVDGHAARAAVHRSSGIASLDAAALTAVRSWRFAPARRGGVAIERDIAVPVRFTLAN